MGGRPKLSKAQRAAAKAAEDAEAWRAETEAALILRDDPAPPLPSWPEAVATFGASAVDALAVTHPNELANACASATALRLFLSVPAAGVLPWRHRAQESLETSLQRLALDDDLQADVKSYRAATLAAGRSAAPPQLQPLEPLAALDGLLLALWGVGRRRREKLAHPVGVMEVAAAVAFGLASVSERCRSLLRAAPAEVRQSWGVREEWVRGDAPAKTPWRKGGCSLLRLLRARWVEAVAVSGGCDCAQPPVRVALLAWQYAGRDAGARWLAFAVPSTAAVEAVVGGGGGGGGAVELGASNGYWARLLATAGLEPFTALDHLPARLFRCPLFCDTFLLSGARHLPARRGGAATPSGGDWVCGEPRRAAAGGRCHACAVHAFARGGAAPPSATNLPPPPPPSHHPRLRIPSPPPPSPPPIPTKADLSDAALESFRGSRVAYIGEWGSGMTGTRHLHDALSEPASWALEAHVPLPNFAKLRIALYLFRRRDPDARSAQQAAPHQAGGKRKRRDAAESIVGCDVCGSRQRRLWRCPWSRQLLVCGEGCYAAAEQRHTATLALCFCGAAPTLRPPFALFEAAAWLERSQASDVEWDSLRDATPQAELKPPGAPRPRAHGSVVTQRQSRS